MLNMTRSEKPPVLVPLAGGITDIRFFRVLIDGARIGIHLKPISAWLIPPIMPQMS